MPLSANSRAAGIGEALTGGELRDVERMALPLLDEITGPDSEACIYLVFEGSNPKALLANRALPMAMYMLRDTVEAADCAVDLTFRTIVDVRCA